MPGCLIAMGRLNRPSLMVYGGTIRAGHCERRGSSTSSRRFSATANISPARSTTRSAQEIVRHACPGAGACGGMYTANTMASAIEALGMSLPYSSSMPAEDPAKLDECFRAGAAIRNLLERDLKPRDIMTRAAFENAMVVVMALGGSTNAVLHLIAMARAVDVPLTIDDFQTRQRPRALSGRSQAERQVRAGRSAQGRRHAGRDEVSAREGLSRRRLPDGHRQDDRRKPARTCRASTPGQEIVHTAREPDQADRPHPDPARQSGARGRRGQDHRQGGNCDLPGRPRSTIPKRTCSHALERKEIGKGDVVVIRYEGPKGGPGHARDAHADLGHHGRRAWARTWR